MKTKIFLIAAGLMHSFQYANAELKKIETKDSYQDWNTGMQRERISQKIESNGKNVTADAIAELVHKKHPGLMPYPEIMSVAALSSKEMLVIMARDSQGEPYPLIRLIQKGSAQEAELVQVGAEKGLYSNWFLDSRIEGWSRVMARSGQYMIQHSTLKIVALGQGELAKVEDGKAFLVENRAGELLFYVIDLATSSKLSELRLDRDCFASPSFSFNHPLLERNDQTEDDQQVKFNYGPKWWDKTIHFDAVTKKLSLKKTHRLLIPPAGLLAVNYFKPKAGADDGGYSVQAAAVSFAGETDESDIIPKMIKDCKIKNPYGFKESQNEKPYITESISAEELCLNEVEAIPKKIIQSVCGSIKSKTIFSAGSFDIVEKNFTYTPYLKEKKPNQISAQVIKTGQKNIQYLSSHEFQEAQRITGIFVLNPKQVLAIARGTGPYNYYLLSDDGDLSISYLGDYAFPSSDFESIGGNRFLYNNRAKILVQKKPFKLSKYAGYILKVSDKYKVNYSDDDRKYFYFYVSDIQDFENPKEIAKYKIAAECLEIKRPLRSLRLDEIEKWFDLHFNISREGKLKLNFETKKCRLVESGDL
jgi:hypothetical protein